MEVGEKVALVTGASSGIGLAAAKLLAQKGTKVALVSRSKLELENAAKELDGSFVVAANLRNEDEARRAAKEVLGHYGRIDILVNNAGRSYFASIEEIETANLREIFELNVIAPIVLMQELIPAMRKQGEGAIVNISSGTVFMRPPIPRRSVYIASKRAIATFSLSAHEELKNENIAVSVVYPYITATNFFRDMLNAPPGMGVPAGDGKRPPPDSADVVAETILRAIESGDAEVFPHEWMKQRGGAGGTD